MVLAIPTNPGFSVISLLGWVPPGKNVSLKNAVALYFYAKDNCFYEKRKHLLIYVNTVSNNLNFALFRSFLPCEQRPFDLPR